MLLAATFLGLLISFSECSSELFINSDFETAPSYETDYLHCTGCVHVQSEDAVSGNYSGLTSERKANWAGYRNFKLYSRNIVQLGRIYEVSAYVKLVPNYDTAKRQKVRIMLDNELTDGKYRNKKLDEQSFTADDGWIKLSTDFFLDDYGVGIKDCSILIQGPDRDVDFHVDLFSLKELDLNINWRNISEHRVSSNLRTSSAKFTIKTGGGFVNPFSGGVLEVKQIESEFGFGAIMEGFKLAHEPVYRDFALNTFEWSTPESELTWKSTEYSRNRATWEDSDLYMSAVEDAGKRVRGRSLFTADRSLNPDWVQTLLRPDDIFRVCMKRIYDLLGRYRFRCNHWDVNPGMADDSFYSDVYLSDSIRDYMYNTAHQVDPAAKLFVDEDILTDATNLQDTLNLVTKMRNKGAEVHGIGSNLHVTPDFNRALLMHRLDKLSVEGVPVWLSDVQVISTDVTKRKNALQDLILLAMGHPTVSGMTFSALDPGLNAVNADRSLISKSGRSLVVNEAGLGVSESVRQFTKTHYNQTVSATGPNEIHEFNFDLYYGEYEVRLLLPDGTIRRHDRISVLPHTGKIDKTYWI